MADYNLVEMFGIADEDEEEQSLLATPEPEEPSVPEVAQFPSDDLADPQLVQMFGGFEEPPAPPEPKEEQGFFGRSWDLLKKSWYKSEGAGSYNEARKQAEQLNTLRETGEYEKPETGGFLGTTVEGMRRETMAFGGQTKELEADIYNSVDEAFKRAVEMEAKGEEISYSEGVLNFLDEESENSAIQDMFADGLGGFASIVWELGLTSGYSSAKGMGAGIAAGIATGGNPFAFAGAMGATSAREEFAFRVAEMMRERGGMKDTASFIKLVSDKEAMNEIVQKAGMQAAIIGSVDAATGGMATKTFGQSFKSIFGREAANLVAQTGIQGTGGVLGEWLAGGLTGEGWEVGREELAEGLGELVTGPMDVAGAAISGAKQKVQAKIDEAEDARLKLVEEVQRRVEEQARLEGADDLEATLIGEETAADFAESIVADLREQEALDRAAVETEPVVEGPEPQTELSDAEVEAEVKTELEREVLQKEAGERYTEGAARNLTEQRAYAAREAEIEAQKVKDAAKARGQVEMEKGEGTAAIEEAGVVAEPATAPMGEVLRAAQQKAKAKKTKTLEGRRTLEKEKAKPALLEDQRPSVIVVDPEGASRPMTAGELDAQIRRRKDLIEQGDLNLTGDWGKNAPNIPVRVMGLDLEIENPKGTTRSGTTPEGEKWSQTFEGAHYGNIKGVRGADNERLDVYIGEQDWRPKGQKIWVVNQYKPDGTFDEHKVMIGFANEQDAISTYEQHNGGEMPRGETVEMTPGEFKRWAFRGKIKNKPLASPNVLRVGTMEDVQAVQERAAFKGNVRPKILYKKADVVVEEVQAPSDEKVASLTEDLSPDGTILEAKEAGEAVGNIVMDRRGNKMQVIWTMVKQGLRGKGTGKNLLLSAVRKANEKGFELVSDSSVSLDQLRVYESLRKAGQLIAEYADPRAVREFLEKHKDTPANSGVTLQLGAMQPVVNRMFIPEYSETIRLRKEEQMDFEGYSYSETRATIDLLLDLMPGIKRENVNILDSFADLPRELQEVLRAKNQEAAPGFYVQDTDQVYLILDNNASMEAAISIFSHEAVAHHGLRRVFGSNIQPLLEDIADGLKNSKALARIAEGYELDLNDPIERLDAVEEYIAHLAETRPSSSIVARVVGAIRQILRQAGLISSWTDNDIQLLLRDVRRELQAKPLDKITITSEAEIEETGEVVTLKQTADVALRRLDKRAGVLEQVRGCLG